VLIDRERLAQVGADDKVKSVSDANETNAAQVRTVMVYTTFPDAEAAAAVGRALVGARLAACVNILPTMTSIYHWEGRCETAAEAVMLIKTRASLADAVVEAIRARHSYDVPAIVVLDIAGGAAPYLAWIASETATAMPAQS
jgi:periplasmic divalent cation tolerance protein